MANINIMISPLKTYKLKLSQSLQLPVIRMPTLKPHLSIIITHEKDNFNVID